MEVDLNTIRRFVTELNTVPKQLQGLVEEENLYQFYSPIGGMTSGMQTIVRQIWQHPYQAAIALTFNHLYNRAIAFVAKTVFERDNSHFTMNVV